MLRIALNSRRRYSGRPPEFQDLSMLNPVGWWKLDEPTGSVCNDSSGNGYHGTYVGSISRIPAISGNSSGAIRTLADGSGAVMPYNAGLNVGTSSTHWSCCITYIWNANAGGHSQTLIKNWASENAGSGNWGLHMSQSSATDVGGYASTYPSFGSGIYVGGTPDPYLGVVYRLWCVRNGDKMYLYRNGVQVGVVTVDINGYSVDAGQGVKIGCGTLYPASYGSRCDLSDAAVFDYSVSPYQILSDAYTYGSL
jgi:hypothetical protein